MDVDALKSMNAGAGGNSVFHTAMLGAMPGSPSPATPKCDAGVQGDAPPKANARPADANPRPDSANTEPKFTLEQVIEDLVVPYDMPARWEFLRPRSASADCHDAG